MINNENSENQNENLITKESSRWQLTEPYNSKKHSVLVFLIQIFYIVSILVLILIGSIFLLESSSNPENLSELINHITVWNKTEIQKFENTKILISNSENKSIQLSKSSSTNTISKYSFSSLSFSTSKISNLLSNSTESSIKSSDITNKSLNLSLSSPLKLIVNDTEILVHDIDFAIKSKTNFSRSQCDTNNGVYDNENAVCYQIFFLKTLCLVLDTEYKSLYHEYKIYKCNRFTPWYESFNLVEWKFPDTNPSLKDVIAQNQIEIKVTTIEDPSIFFEMVNESETDKEDGRNLKGIWLIIIAAILIVVGFVFYFHEHGEREQNRIVSMKQEMTNNCNKNKKKNESSTDEECSAVPNPLLRQ